MVLLPIELYNLWYFKYWLVCSDGKLIALKIDVNANLKFNLTVNY